MDKVNLENLPSFMKNMNAVLEENPENVSCLHGQPPNYSGVNQLYFTERTKVHPPGSLEDLVTNLIKNWEKELAHITDPTQWKTVDIQNFRASVNGCRFHSLAEVAEIGNYNLFIGNTELYCASLVTDPNESHHIFRTAMKGGFPFEVLEVYCTQPKVVFKWRHWGKVEGEVNCPKRNGEILNVKPSGNKVEIFGTAIMLLNEKFQIMEMEFFFRPDTMMEQLAGIKVPVK